MLYMLTWLFYVVWLAAKPGLKLQLIAGMWNAEAKRGQFFTVSSTSSLLTTLSSRSGDFRVDDRRQTTDDYFTPGACARGNDSKLSYLDLELSIVDSKFRTAVFDKRDGFNFHIDNFPHMNSNIPNKPTYGVYISQFVRPDRPYLW